MSGCKKLLNLMNFLKKSYNEESDEGYFLEADVQYLEIHNDLRFLPERMKIEKGEKLIFIM